MTKSKSPFFLLIFLGATYYEVKTPNSFLYEKIIMPSVKKMDPELAHKVSILSLKYGLHPKVTFQDPSLKVSLFGKEFKNPLGIAAGFDKNAEVISSLNELGFGFVEVGSITPKPQEGNPKPRIFRYPNYQAIVNRCGFNNQGFEKVKSRLEVRDEKIILGVNIGKNKTSQEKDDSDYIQGLEELGKYGDYVVVNISSPNTPGLRTLQNKENLDRLLSNLFRKKKELHLKQPILVKIAPDLTQEQVEELTKVLMEHKVDGIIVSNTTIQKPNSEFEQGGLSGKPLFEPSTELLRTVYKLTNGTIPLIGVGGIFTGKDAYEKIKAGATLVQLYSSMTYKGPAITEEINKELVELMKKDNIKNIQDAIGLEFKK